ncbi:MAG: PAS domain S-box protein [Armatimonadota bacterium]
MELERRAGGRTDELVEQELQEAKTFLEHLIATSPGINFRGNPTDFSLSYVSPNIERILGFAPEAILGVPGFWPEHIHPEHREQFLVKRDRALAKRAAHIEYECRFLHKDGEYRWLSMMVRIEYDTAGSPVIVLGYALDITARKRAEQDLAVQYAVSRVLAESTSLDEAAPELLQTTAQGLGWDIGALWTVDGRANVLRCHALWKATGIRATEFEAITRKTAFPPGVGLPGRVWESGEPAWIRDVVTDSNFPRAPIAARDDLHGAFGFPIRTGREVFGIVEFFSREIRAPDDDLLRRMAAIGNQIGQFMDRKRAEEAMRESEARKGAILEAALDCIITMDHEGKIIEFNPAAEKTFGYSRSEVLGREMAELIIPPPLRASHRKGLAHFLATGEGPVLGKRIEIPAVRADGTEFPVELAITRIASDGPPTFTGFIRDVTERKAAEELVMHAKEEAERANRAKSEFLSRMSHELRTPLNAILGFGQLLEMAPRPSQERKSVDRILRAGRHLLDLINEVLDIARVDSGGLEVHAEPVSLADVLQESLELVAPLAAARNISVNGKLAQTGNGHVLADRQRLKQVFLNLLSNAVKYNREGGTVALSCEETPQGRMRILVTDTGPGIPGDMLERLFIPFERLGAERTNIEGTGIGLALSRRLMELMDGDIGVESTVGEGSTFWVELPLADGRIDLDERAREDVPAEAAAQAPGHRWW